MERGLVLNSGGAKLDIIFIKYITKLKDEKSNNQKIRRLEVLDL